MLIGMGDNERLAVRLYTLGRAKRSLHWPRRQHSQLISSRVQ